MARPQELEDPVKKTVNLTKLHVLKAAILMDQRGGQSLSALLRGAIDKEWEAYGDFDRLRALADPETPTG